MTMAPDVLIITDVSNTLLIQKYSMFRETDAPIELRKENQRPAEKPGDTIGLLCPQFHRPW